MAVFEEYDEEGNAIAVGDPLPVEEPLDVDAAADDVSIDGNKDTLQTSHALTRSQLAHPLQLLPPLSLLMRVGKVRLLCACDL